jgi:cation diffusion facilitator family transporter
MPSRPSSSSTANAPTRLAQAQRVTLVSIVINAVLTVLQISVGLFAHAQSLVADGFHSLADLVDDIFVLFASRYSHSPADDDHPYGHERIETVASLVLGLLLAITGAAILWGAIGRLQDFDAAPALHPLALWIALLTLVAKEGLFRYMLRIGEVLRSPMLVANAWHARADAASSLVVAAGIGGSLLGWKLLDPLAAAVVGLMILRMSWKFTFEALRELVDTAIPGAEQLAIRASILDTPGVLACHELRSRRMAHKVLVDARIQVAPRISVSEGHHIAEAVHDRVLDTHPDVLDVMVHIDVESEGLRTAHQQPDRAALHAALEEAGLPALSPESLILHYLNHGLEIRLLLPPNAPLPDTRRLLNKLQAQFGEAQPPLLNVEVAHLLPNGRPART